MIGDWKKAWDEEGSTKRCHIASKIKKYTHCTKNEVFH